MLLQNLIHSQMHLNAVASPSFRRHVSMTQSKVMESQLAKVQDKTRIMGIQVP